MTKSRSSRDGFDAIGCSIAIGAGATLMALVLFAIWLLWSIVSAFI